MKTEIRFLTEIIPAKGSLLQYIIFSSGTKQYPTSDEPVFLWNIWGGSVGVFVCVFVCVSVCDALVLDVCLRKKMFVLLVNAEGML